MKKLLLTFFSLLILVAVGCKGGKQVVGLPAPEFSATSLDGQEIKLAGLKGKPVLLYYFASW